MPGGVNKNLTLAERDELLADIEQTIAWSRDAVQIVRRLFEQNLGLYRSVRRLPGEHAEPGARRRRAWTCTTAGCARATRGGNGLFDHAKYDRYWERIIEEVKAWTYMKFPYLKALGAEQGWYRVGPLARVHALRFHPDAAGRARASRVPGLRRRPRRHVDARLTTGRA